MAVVAVVLGPALRPGYVLTGDQVFVPDQTLLPWMLGLGGGLPRSVPQDAVVALVTGPVPGWVWEKVALLGALSTLGLGVARLLRPAGRRAAVVGAVAAVWSPYVAERLLQGHWSLLLAVAVLPWAVAQADAARRGEVRAASRWVLLVGLASLTVTGGLLVLLVTAPLLLVPGALSRRARVAALVGGVVLQLPWLVPSLVHPVSPAPLGADVFALRSEGWWGSLLTALGTGGLWNAGSVPSSRATVLAPIVTVVLLALAFLGSRGARRVLGTPVLACLGTASALGLAVAVAGSWSATAGVTAWVVAHVPGGGVIRDGQKLLAPWLILLSCLVGLGAARLSRAVHARRGAPAAAAAAGLLAVVPLLGVPDLVWGAQGRLAAVRYPDDWNAVRDVLLRDAAPGDVVSLPWSTFRRFDWNDGRTVLDPAPRFLPRTVVADDRLLVSRGGEVVVVPGDDPRSAAVGEALRTGAPLGPVLRSVGVGWVLVEPTTAGPSAPSPPAGAVLVHRGSTLSLYRLAAPASLPPPPGRPAVLSADASALAVLVTAALVAVAAPRRRARAPGADGARAGARGPERDG